MMEKSATGKSTFIVQVQFCQNSSWQGTIAWTEQKKEQRFRSALELMKLIDEALTSERDDKISIHWE